MSQLDKSRRKRYERSRRRRARKRSAGKLVLALLILGGLAVGAFFARKPIANMISEIGGEQEVSSQLAKIGNFFKNTENFMKDILAASGGKGGVGVAQADWLAAQYDYDSAIQMLQSMPGYENNETLIAKVAEYEAIKATCVPYPLDQITHVFYHTLIRDTSKAFDGDYDSAGYNQVMTTIDEFNQITQSMYDKGFVMVNLSDISPIDENGNMQRGEIFLPPGKKPFVLSQDDVSYYHYMEGDGFAARLVLDDKGQVKNEYIEDDGSISIGDYDMVPLIDAFVKEHPDFSYRGAKGIIALTGYDGVLGYRTDVDYQNRSDLTAGQSAWLAAHPDFNLETERENGKKVADAMKANGWVFASHTWGHMNIGTADMERIQWDTTHWHDNVVPVVGETDIVIFPFGADLGDAGPYSGEKFEYYKSQGFNYFCNVNSAVFWVQFDARYFRQGRRNLDGYRMYYHPERVDDLFDAKTVFDPARPTPVAPMG